MMLAPMADTPSHSLGAFSAPVFRRLLAIFVPAALLTGGVVFALYYQDLDKEHTIYEQAGSHLVELQTDIIDREFSSVETDLLILANLEVLQNYLSAAGKSGAREKLEDEYVLYCRHKGIYDQIRYLDADGWEKIRINYQPKGPSIVPTNELQPKADRPYFQSTIALDRDQVYISPFDLNVEQNKVEEPYKPCIRFATPVFDKQGVKRGIVVLNYLGAVLIQKLARVSMTFPGVSVLLNRDGFYLRGPTPEDEWGFMLDHRRSRCFPASYPQEWERLAQRKSGQFQTEHGLFTFQTLSLRSQLAEQRRPLPATLGRPDADEEEAALKVVSQISPAVLEGPATRLLRTLLSLAGVVLLVILVLAWYLAFVGTLRRNQERQLADSEARLRTLSTQLITAQEDERRSLSRDLHDELGQLVTAVKLDLQRAAQAGDPQKKDELLGRAKHGTECLLESIHEISTRVRPTLLDDLGLKDAVQSYLSEYEQRTGIITRAELRLEQPLAPAAVSQNVFRILQEALTNVAKHSKAGEVFVTLASADRRVHLTVRDAGVGFTPDALDGKRLGLLGMRERAELLDGTFAVQSAPGQGTEIRVALPINQGP